MKQFKKAVVYYATLPLDLLVAFPMVLIVRLLWGEKLRWKRGVLSTVFREQSWALGGKVDEITGLLEKPGPHWYPKGFYLYNYRRAKNRFAMPKSWGGTSIGHGHLYGPGKRNDLDTCVDCNPTSIEIHEDHHTRQAEAAQLGAAFLAHILLIVEFIQRDFITGIILFIAIWLLGGNILVSIGGWLNAVLTDHPEGFYRGSAHELGAYAIGRIHALENSKGGKHEREEAED